MTTPPPPDEPLDLAVLCCLPLQRDAWRDRARLAPPAGDFVRFGAATVGADCVDTAWAAFEREAAFLERKFQAAERDRVPVYRRAGVEHLRDAMARHTNLALFAHWKGPDLLPGDPPGCGNRLETWDDMIDADTLASLFPSNWAGTVFLAVCTSVRPAETLRRRVPRAICICSREGVSAGLSMARLDAARRLIAADRSLPLWKGLLQGAEMIDQLARKP
jgi:hypothetical protein